MSLIQAFIPPPEEPSRCHQRDLSELFTTAAAFGYKNVIDYLATHPDTQKRKSTAQILVKTAVAKGWHLTTQRLVDHYGKDILFGTDDYYRSMALMVDAAQSGKPCMARLLLEFGCNVLEPNAQDELPLLKSVEVKAGAVTDILLAAGAGTPKAINSALSLAFSRYDTDPKTFEQLFAYAPDRGLVRGICIQHKGKTPIEFAVENGYRMLKVMLEAGFYPNDFIEKIPLKNAIGRNDNDAETVRLLLQYGADPEASWKDGNTALHAAGYHGSVAALKLLFDAGLESTKNNEGVTPPFYCSCNKLC